MQHQPLSPKDKFVLKAKTEGCPVKLILSHHLTARAAYITCKIACCLPVFLTDTISEGPYWFEALCLTWLCLLTALLGLCASCEPAPSIFRDSTESSDLSDVLLAMFLSFFSI